MENPPEPSTPFSQLIGIRTIYYNKLINMQIGSTEWKDIIICGAKYFAVQVGSGEAGKFSIHAGELIKWNSKTNLTAITDPFEVAVKHFLDSLAPARIIPPGSSMLDMGSGGGFPGIPLKIILPSLSVSLVDSSRKKVSFLKHVIRTLGLEGINAFQARVENLSENKERFDVVICRAFSSLDKFIESALPVLAENGIMIALKGKISYKETESARLSDNEKRGYITASGLLYDIEVVKYSLPYIDSERTLMVIKKLR
ncbi:MAG: 16S rRNA (guanine(527)-N(7))-methyltransferase RsmG [Candidatus Delongbacteria bacterium]|nr:16S rRNA (guanine(527)-N(7))-methyltransferase RsmG [Candidatus Delongbacteria bacterium]